MSVNYLDPDEMKKLTARIQKTVCLESPVKRRLFVKRPICKELPYIQNSVNKELPAAGNQEEKEEYKQGAGAAQHEICNYSDTDYASFWKEHNRAYEDNVERMALRHLTFDISGSCLEIGAGYGRLVNEYAGFCSEVLLLDYAPNLLDQARSRIKRLGLENVQCMRGDLYDLRSLNKRYDNAICIRVMHHVEDVPDFFQQVNFSLEDNGTFILEYANKRNIVEILRYLFKRPNIKPFDYAPSKRGNSVYFNFHPDYIRDMLNKNGFMIEEEMGVSFFRSEFLKKRVNYKILSKLESFLQRPLGRFHLSPSVFIKARKVR